MAFTMAKDTCSGQATRPNLRYSRRSFELKGGDSSVTVNDLALSSFLSIDRLRHMQYAVFLDSHWLHRILHILLRLRLRWIPASARLLWQKIHALGRSYGQIWGTRRRSFELKEGDSATIRVFSCTSAGIHLEEPSSQASTSLHSRYQVMATCWRPRWRTMTALAPSIPRSATPSSALAACLRHVQLRPLCILIGWSEFHLFFIFAFAFAFLLHRTCRRCKQVLISCNLLHRHLHHYRKGTKR